MYALRHCDPKARLHSFSSGTMTVPGACSRLRAGANNTCLHKCRVIELDVAARSARTERPRPATAVLILPGVYHVCVLSALEVHAAGIAPWVALFCRKEPYAHSKEAN